MKYINALEKERNKKHQLPIDIDDELECLSQQEQDGLNQYIKRRFDKLFTIKAICDTWTYIDPITQAPVRIYFYKLDMLRSTQESLYTFIDNFFDTVTAPTKTNIVLRRMPEIEVYADDIRISGRWGEFINIPKY